VNGTNSSAKLIKRFIEVSLYFHMRLFLPSQRNCTKV